MMGLHLQYPAHLLARLFGAAITPVRPCEIHARPDKLRSGSEHTLERLDACRDLLLVQERDTEEPQTVHLTRILGLERPQGCFRGGGTPGAQQRMRAAQAVGEFGVSVGSDAHESQAADRTRPAALSVARAHCAIDAGAVEARC